MIKCYLCNCSDNYSLCKECISNYFHRIILLRNQSLSFITKINSEITKSIKKVEKEIRPKSDILSNITLLSVYLNNKEKLIEKKQLLINLLQKELNDKRSKMNELPKIRYERIVPINNSLIDYSLYKSKIVSYHLNFLIKTTGINTNFNPADYFEADEYINIIKSNQKSKIVKRNTTDFNNMNNKFSVQDNHKLSDDYNVIEVNIEESILIKQNSNLISLFAYLYKLMFIINKMSSFLKIQLPYKFCESRFILKGRSTNKLYYLFDNNNYFRQNLSEGYVLLNENLKYLACYLYSDREKDKGFIFNNFLNLSILQEPGESRNVTEENQEAYVRNLTNSVVLVEYSELKIISNYK